MQLSLPLDAEQRFEELRHLDGEGWWDRWEALPEPARPATCKTVACPKCGVPAGTRCRRPSGHSGPAVGAHADRWNRVLAEAESTKPVQRRRQT